MNKRNVRQMVAEAKQQIENLTPGQVAAEVAANQILLLDIREAGELLQKGVIPGAVAAPRGMLEFYADTDSPYHREEFDPQRRMILYCASGERSALAAATLRQIGYTNIAHLDGGLEAWQAAKQPVVTALKWHQPQSA
ncbi:MAG: sulfurtransferase [Anaerolineaceae bacterium]|nr:sulfurtransferase [Anaerolineaceae bacterium]